ncbi:MAG: ferredoxin family protein [Rickettsiaceae bacterium]|nr:ferredoxin family protein [Rickettsiaceae bacterium]
MTYVVTDACVRCKYTDCADVCPVSCFREGELMMVINPDECIDCGVCEPECPVGAIEPEGPNNVIWVERARKFSAVWPVITTSKAPLPDADKYKDEHDKFEKYIGEDS